MQMLKKSVSHPHQIGMEDSTVKDDLVEDEEEYVLLDFEGLDGQINFSAGIPFVLTGLDSLNPVLVIGDNTKLVGEYQETIGTCIVFNESDTKAPVVMYPETETSELDLFKDKCIVEDTNAPNKQVKPLASLQKILKFKLVKEDCVVANQTNRTNFS